MSRVIGNLVVDPERMARNLELTKGLLFSQRVLLFLIDESGISREEAYAIVQENAMRCWAGEGHLRELLSSDSRVNNVLDEDALDRLFDYGYYIRYVNEIFSRFEKSGKMIPQND